MIGFFNFDGLALIMVFLTVIIGFVSFKFSRRYLNGDRLYKSFFIRLTLMICALITTFCSDNIILFATSWFLANVLLITLMIHKKSWMEAYYSGILTAKYFGLSFVCLVGSLFMFYLITGKTSISEITSFQFTNDASFDLAIGLLSIFIIVQSGLLPFHKWLTSSLNSPTPISAMMHAGIINGGGFIFLRFASIYLQHSIIMDVMFGFGMIAVLIGTTWKLMQNDVKKMLACSTISQMGYMICQCSIGAFAPAIMHIIMHGFFKANLFFHSPSSATEIRQTQNNTSFLSFILSIIFGLLITSFFIYGFNGFILKMDTNLVVISIVFIFASQFVLTTINSRNSSLFKSVFGLLFACIGAFLYGKVISLLDHTSFLENFQNHLELQWIHKIGRAHV